MKVRVWVRTGMVGSKVEAVIDVDDIKDFEDNAFETWVWDHICAGFEALP